MIHDQNSRAAFNLEPGKHVLAILRAALFVDGTVFLSAALFNFGVKLPLGFTELGFTVPIWQAGVGEAVIGLVLLSGAVTGRVALAWAAFGLSVFGIVFGLSSPRVQGAARDVHVLLVPLAIIVFGLLLWQSWQSRRLRQPHVADSTGAPVVAPVARAPWRPVSIAICVLMLVATAAFVVASLIHFGVVIGFGSVVIADPFRGAAIPEAIIAGVLGIGSAAVVTRRPSTWVVAIATTLFAFFVTIYGLTITLGSARTGDVAYHISILAVLAVTVGLLLLPTGRRSLTG